MRICISKFSHFKCYTNLSNINKILIKKFNKQSSKPMLENIALQKRHKPLKRYSLDYLDNIVSNNQHRVFIESHRGVNREEPENTLVAFEKAIQLECDSIEMDIWLTKDKIPIVIHGDEEGNIDKKYGKINSHDFESIAKIRLEREQKIPKLEEVLRLCKNRIFLNLELKDPNHKETFEEVHKLVTEYEMHKEVQISSFRFNYFDALIEYGLHAKIEFGFLHDRSCEKNLELNFNFKQSMINLWYGDVTKEIIEKAHRNHIGVMAWFCMNDEETYEIIHRLIDMKIDVICTNDPRNALKIRENYYKTRANYGFSELRI